MKNPGMIVHNWKIEREREDERLDIKLKLLEYVKKRKPKRNAL